MLLNTATGRTKLEEAESGFRCTSRTLSQAYMYIGTALSAPEASFVLVDHSGVRGGHERLAYEVEKLASQSGVIGIKVTRENGKHYISYNPYVGIKELIDVYNKSKA